MKQNSPGQSPSYLTYGSLIPRAVRVFTALAVCASASFALAANPETGMVDPNLGSKVTFTGNATGPASEGEQTCVDGVTCDVFELTVTGQPSDYVGKAIQVNLDWETGANDFDLVIRKDSVNGPVVGSSGNGPPSSEESGGINPAATGTGVYIVRVVYFAFPVVADQYRGTAETVSRPAERGATYIKGGGIQFSPNVTVKAPNTVRDGEPSSRTDFQGNYYVGGIRGVPAGVDLWNIDLNPSSPQYDPLMRNPIYRGQPDSFTNKDTNQVGADGGGDIDLAVGFGLQTGQTVPTLAFSSLVAANISVGNSKNKGATFNLNPLGNLTGGPPIDDREWQEFFGKDVVFLLYRTIAPVIAFVHRSADGGFTYGPAVLVGPSSQVGGIDVNQNDGTVYNFFIDGRVAVGIPSAPGREPTSYTFHQAASDPFGLRNIFVTGKVAEDGTPNGTVYVTYSNGFNVYLVHSTDRGVTWSQPVRVSDLPGGANIFPWLETGKTAGSVVLTWYGTENQPFNNDAADWKVYFAQSFNANSANPTFTQVVASDHFIHGSNISTGGLTGTANRNLIDYFQISVDPQGAAVIGYTDDHNDTDGATYVTRQISGPSLNGGTVSLPATLPALTPPTGKNEAPPPVPGPDGEQVTDFRQDSRGGAASDVDADTPADILSIKYRTSEVDGKTIVSATMKLSGLAALPANALFRMNFTANAPDSVLSATGDYTYGLSDRGDQFFMSVTTTAPALPTYRYGTAVRLPTGALEFTNKGFADSGSFDAAKGTLTVNVDLAKFNELLTAAGKPNLGPGSPLVGLRGTSNAGGFTDNTRGGTLFVVGNGPLPTATPPPTSTPAPAIRLANIAGRSLVQQNDNIGIGGFIVRGSGSKRVMIRGIGSSLKSGDAPLPGRLADPIVDLRGESGAVLQQNDNWRQSSQQQEIQDTGIAPSDDNEAAIVMTLAPGTYTAVLQGANGSQGIGVVEIYDLEPTAGPELANLAARAFVSTGDNILVGGVILNGVTPKRVLLRGIGPSLSGSLPNALANPTMQLFNGNGDSLATNDNWKDAPNAGEITATGIAPTNDAESAILLPLGPGLYTAVVNGVDNGTGNGVVEIYRLD